MWAILGPDLLPRFFRGLKKQNGEHHLSASITNMLNLIQRILQEQQKTQIDETHVSELLIDIRYHSLFCRTTQAVVHSMEKSVKASANIPRKKVDIFILEMEL